MSTIFNPDRLERACLRACSYNNYSYESIKGILEKKLEEKALEEEAPLIKLSLDNSSAYLRPASEYITGGAYHG